MAAGWVGDGCLLPDEALLQENLPLFLPCLASQGKDFTSMTSVPMR